MSTVFKPQSAKARLRISLLVGADVPERLTAARRYADQRGLRFGLEEAVLETVTKLLRAAEAEMDASQGQQPKA
ncbi:MAG TPA: hypothetical protein VFA75_05340 [Nevskia sp.]|nr:hypothetical protein [Nevskia sp.]